MTGKCDRERADDPRGDHQDVQREDRFHAWMFSLWGAVQTTPDLGVVVRAERRPGRLRKRPRSWVVVDVEPQRDPMKRRRAVGGHSFVEKGPPAAVETLLHIRPDRKPGGRSLGRRDPYRGADPPAAVDSTLSKREDDAPEDTAGGLPDVGVLFARRRRDIFS